MKNDTNNESNSVAKPERTPARYKLYDGIKEKVSLQTMDKIIFAIIALIAILLLIGIFGH